jgi:hypothetical protein
MIAISTGRNAPNLFRTVACVFILMVSAVDSSVAQTDSRRAEFETAPTTVVTMTPNGSWGAATNDFVGPAIAAAIADCRHRSRRATGCGALQTTVRAGWIFGIRCGDKNILVAEKTLREAEQTAINQEVELRHQYGRELPPCVRLVSVDPSGTVVAPYAKGLVSMISNPPQSGPTYPGGSYE